MIIHINSDIPDDIALELVLEVVKQGKISQDSKGNKFYCWVTELTKNDINYDVIVNPNLNQPSFAVARHID